MRTGTTVGRTGIMVAGLVCFAGCVSIDDQVRTMKEYNAISAAPGTAPDHDYTVVMQNLRPLGVEMANKTDRQKLAVAFLGDRCPAGHTVSETEMASHTPGLTKSSDYAVRIKC